MSTKRPRGFADWQPQDMVPLVKRIADPYGIVVVSGGGFDSTTGKYQLAETLSQYPESEVLDISDHDPSGPHKFQSLAEDCRRLPPC